MRVATIDLETDPFKYGRTPSPFAAGFYDGEIYREFWGADCVKQLLAFIKTYPQKLVIYAHNGGRFDFWYLSHAVGEPLLFIDSRLVKGALFHHEIRDSYKILPVPLSAIEKDKIDYALFEKPLREKHKAKILAYLKSDCVYLWDAVSKFTMQFGNVLTIGGAALKELQREYRVPRITPAQDAQYREYFHGGRCEVFEAGEVKSKRGFKLYDVNSLYPHCMSEFYHPVGAADYVCAHIPDAKFYLAHIRADSHGALPVRTKTGLTFPHGNIESYCTSHEIQMAQKLGLIKITEVIECHAWDEVTKFNKFVHKFNLAKIHAEQNGDMTGRTFNKLIMNNAFGKTAQNPERFKEYRLFDSPADCLAAEYEIDGELGARIIGARPAEIRANMYKNVAVAASVTGAGRAVWLHAFAHAARPVYGDTDSLWCESLPLELDPVKLGAWKLEARADTLYIAGKKLYAAWSKKTGFYESQNDENVKAIKMASKGVRLKPEDIARIAKGEVLAVPVEAPSLHIGRAAKFIQRKIARTSTCA